MNFYPEVSGYGVCEGWDGASEKDFRAEIIGKLCLEKARHYWPK